MSNIVSTKPAGVEIPGAFLILYQPDYDFGWEHGNHLRTFGLAAALHEGAQFIWPC